MKKIIVTADDFGMCSYVNNAIIDLIDFGTLTSTNVLTNMYALDGIEKLKERPNVSVGIHWNIISGKPVSDPKEIPTLVDGEGQFHSLVEFKKLMHSRKISMVDVEKELRAQYLLFYKSYGKTASYWNTHENSSHVKAVFDLCCKLGVEYHIPATRVFDRVYLDFDDGYSFPRKIREYIVRTILHNRYKGIRKYFKMPDGRLVAFSNKIKLDIERNRKAILSSKYNTIEMVIHPATQLDDELFGNIGEDRIMEYKLYMTKEMYDLLHNEEIQTSNFEQL